jgi:hypothetical protein
VDRKAPSLALDIVLTRIVTSSSLMRLWCVPEWGPDNLVGVRILEVGFDSQKTAPQLGQEGSLPNLNPPDKPLEQ